jgi:hypothetical protein
MALTPVTFQDFHGGIADLYIGTDITRAQILDNFLIDETNKPYVRNGSFIFQTRLPYGTNSTQPTGIYLGTAPYSHPIAVVGPHAYTMNESATWTEILGPNTSFLPTKTDAIRENGILWRRQLIACGPVTGLPPAMIYNKSFVAPSNPATPATYSALTLGLPPMAVTPSSPSVPDTATTYNTVYAFFWKYSFSDSQSTIFEFFGNPNAIPYFPGSSTADPSSASISLTSLPVLSNTSLTNYDVSTSVTVASLSVTSGSQTATVTNATGIKVGMQIVVNNANGTYGYIVPGTVVTAINGLTLTLSQTPTLASSAVYQFVNVVFTTLTLQIYRTINGGSVFFFAGMVGNGTTSYTDNMSDANLQTNSPIYTSGGALGYDQPPTGAIAVTQTNDFFWYVTSSAIYQSIQGSPGSCPSGFSDQIDQKIIGISDVISFPILFCDKSVYRIEGTFDSFGNSGYVLREISKTAGCISNASIVKTPYGLVWFGNGAIYSTDGYNVIKISRHLNYSYQNWANTSVIGEYDPSKNLVYWTISNNGSPANNAFLVLHLAYGLTDQSVFSTLSSSLNIYPTALKFSQASDIATADPAITTTATWSSSSSTMSVTSVTGIIAGQSVSAVGFPYGTTVLSISGTTVTLSNASTEAGSNLSVTFSQVIYSQLYGKMLFTDRNGYLLWFDPNALADVKINTSMYPSAMPKKTIMYDYTTAGLDQGTAGFRKYTPDVSLEIDSSTPVAMQIRHRRDDGGGGWSGEGGTPPTGRGVAGSPGGGSSGNPGVPELRQDGAITFGITDCTWLSDPNEHLWNDFATLAGKRSVPAGLLRSGRRQLKFTNSYTVIAGSDTLGTATVVLATVGNYPTITLDNYPTQIWITDPEGYYITFDSDGYTQTFYIKSRLSDQTLQLTNPLSLLVAGSQKWEIKGYRKFERPRILNFTLYAEVEGPNYGQATSPIGANSS